jgi:hypothetical protein
VIGGPRDFFDRAFEVFQAARHVADAVASQRYVLGGLATHVEIVGREMQSRLAPALSHLPHCGESEPLLTVCAWDTAASGTPMIPPPWGEADYGPRGAIHAYNDARFRTAFDHSSDTLSMIDHERKLALFWTRDASRLPMHECAAPFRIILSWSAEQHGRVVVHCGAVSNEDGAVLLAGAGGSGKSTTTLLCVKAGWRYLGDDYCALQTGPRPEVFSLYNSAKLTHDSAERFGLKEVLPPASANDGMKELFFLRRQGQAQLANAVPCRLLLLPRVTNQRDTTVEKASPGDALRALAPSSIFQFSGAGAIAFERLAQLVRALPIVRLNLGSDLGQIPAVIARCVSDL